MATVDENSAVDGNSTVGPKRRGVLITFNKDQWAGLFGEGGYLWGNIDPAKSAGPLTIWCFLTGYMSVVHFFLQRERNPRI